ncbi:MAG: hypothetical protein NTX50_30765 [Candidatus Sumerlaeota bacterium]|nr:hypothetical protein [Candidatus Sumerlaeota bacterium]
MGADLAKACREAALKRARVKGSQRTPLLKQDAKKSRLKPANAVGSLMQKTLSAIIDDHEQE